MSEQPVVLITGVSSGNGKAMALHFAENGFTVFGTSRHPNKDVLPGVDILPLDVRSDESVKTCVEEVLKRAGRLDVLVNNAGFALVGALEETSLSEAKEQFDTNFFGALRMIKAVLPALRRQRYGRIINVSSIVGLVPLPFMGIYSAGKFALEGYSEALSHEVKPFGIYISLIEPGFIKTQIGNHAKTAASPISVYDPWRIRTVNAIEKHIAKAPPPELVARHVLCIVKSRSPKMRTIVGREANLVRRLRSYLPAAVFHQIWRREFEMDKAH